jgi:hypothetical protein
MENKPLIMIDWYDHTGDGGWHTQDSIKAEKPITARTVGYLIEENQECYKIVDTLTDDNGCGGLSIILKSCVKDLWLIEMK